MESSSSLSISKHAAVLVIFGLVHSCTTEKSAYEELTQGTIAYPFPQATRPLGKNGTEDKFVIRTSAGGREYSVEIPAAAADYDVEVPLADLNGGEGESGTGNARAPVQNAQVTDREIVANMPHLAPGTEEERALLDKAFGVGETGGPRQSPSYTMGLARVGEFYQQLKFEYALIEINNLLAYYPTSVKLYQMKGTVLLKLGSVVLAERAWLRAQELAPRDLVIKKGLERLRRRMDLEQTSESARSGGPPPDENSGRPPPGASRPVGSNSVPPSPVPDTIPIPDSGIPDELNKDLDGANKLD